MKDIMEFNDLITNKAYFNELITSAVAPNDGTVHAIIAAYSYYLKNGEFYSGGGQYILSGYLYLYAMSKNPYVVKINSFFDTVHINKDKIKLFFKLNRWEI